MKKIKVYIAGPYTKGDINLNVSNAIDLWHDLRDAGFSPYCPHLTHFLGAQKARSYEEWLEYDLEWLELCDALIRIPGESAGSDREMKFARMIDIPVFMSITDLISHYQLANKQI